MVRPVFDGLHRRWHRSFAAVDWHRAQFLLILDVIAVAKIAERIALFSDALKQNVVVFARAVIGSARFRFTDDRFGEVIEGV